MTSLKRKKYKKHENAQANKQFFLYVFFHSIWTSIFSVFDD